jgi:hypothetical protein
LGISEIEEFKILLTSNAVVGIVTAIAQNVT